MDYVWSILYMVPRPTQLAEKLTPSRTQSKSSQSALSTIDATESTHKSMENVYVRTTGAFNASKLNRIILKSCLKSSDSRSFQSRWFYLFSWLQ